MTLDETGMIDALMVDYYFMSTNTMTIDGELVNIDGNGNRIAALIYSPENVIILAGMNKVAKDVAEAVDRHFYLSICLNNNSIFICIYLSSLNMKNTSNVTDFIFDLSTLEVSYHSYTSKRPLIYQYFSFCLYYLFL